METIHYRVMSLRHGAEEGRDHGNAYPTFDAANEDAQRIFSDYTEMDEPLSADGYYIDHEARVSVMVCECANNEP